MLVIEAAFLITGYVDTLEMGIWQACQCGSTTSNGQKPRIKSIGSEDAYRFRFSPARLYEFAVDKNRSGPYALGGKTNYLPRFFSTAKTVDDGNTAITNFGNRKAIR